MPLQPFSMFTPKPPPEIVVPVTETGSPSKRRMAPETEAMSAVNGTTAWSLTGRQATRK